MKKQELKKYIYYGVTAIIVIAVCILFAYCIIEKTSIVMMTRKIAGILAPITCGAVFAYLFTPVYNRSSEKVLELSKRAKFSDGTARKLSRFAGTFISFVFLILILVGLFQMLIPQIITSLMGIKETMPANIESFSLWLKQTLDSNPDAQAFVLELYDQIYVKVRDGFLNFDVSRLEVIVSGVSSGVWSIVMLIKNFLIGLIVMVYLLNIKHTLAAQGKKIIYGMLPVRWANAVVDELRLVHKTFGGFIIGKLLDSLIIGIICFVGVSVMKMPYALLISVIIGVTNVIPFFGPFIGAIPTGFLILLVSPVKCVYFLLFILALQQFDGNILGPKILGDSTGLSSFWVLFSILLFGGLFGFVGMIIGVPTFAVIYDLISKAVCGSLKKKQLSTLTLDYEKLDYVDEEQNTFINK